MVGAGVVGVVGVGVVVGVFGVVGVGVVAGVDFAGVADDAADAADDVGPG